MELPVAKQSYMPPADALVRAVKRAEPALAQTVVTAEAMDAGNVYVSAARPGVPMVNFATDLVLPDGADAGATLDDVLRVFAAAGARCAWLESAAATWPEALARAAEARGFRAEERKVFLLHGYQRPKRLNDQLQILPARAVFGQMRELMEQMARNEHRADGSLTKAMADTWIDQLDETRLEMILGRLERQPVGAAGVLALGQMGVIWPAYTDPRQRGTGIAGTLMAHVIDHCERALFEQVLIDRHAGCPAIPFYESLGFKPVASFVRYHHTGS